MGSTKTEKQISHFFRRYYDRTDSKCSYELYNKIVKDIQNGKLIKIGKQSNRVHMYEHIVNDTKYALIYDKFRKTLVTILFITEPFLIENKIIKIRGFYYQIDSDFIT